MEDLLVAYGGTREEFDSLPDVSRVFVSDPRLRDNKTTGKAKLWRRVARSGGMVGGTTERFFYSRVFRRI